MSAFLSITIIIVDIWKKRSEQIFTPILSDAVMLLAILKIM